MTVKLWLSILNLLTKVQDKNSLNRSCLKILDYRRNKCVYTIIALLVLVKIADCNQMTMLWYVFLLIFCFKLFPSINMAMLNLSVSIRADSMFKHSSCSHINDIWLQIWNISNFWWHNWGCSVVLHKQNATLQDILQFISFFVLEVKSRS